MESLGKTPLNRNAVCAGNHRCETTNSSQALGCMSAHFWVQDPFHRGPHREADRAGHRETRPFSQKALNSRSVCCGPALWHRLSLGPAQPEQQVFLQDREVTCRPHRKLQTTL